MSAIAADHDEHIHMPEPSIWPIILAFGILFLPVGTLLTYHGVTGGAAILGAGTVVTLIAAMGWAGSVIHEKTTIDIEWGTRSLSTAWKLFLLSESAIFGAFFGHFGYTLYHAGEDNPLNPVRHIWPPVGTPHIHLIIPALGLMMLLLSSATCEFAHKALLVNQRGLAKTWLIVTLVLGWAFMGLQGYEWAYLISYDNFTLSTNIFGTQFYLITGFHGFHVITGILFLFLVYTRMEMGSLTPSRHFSMTAASWYWHFVDVIWLFVFLGVYVGATTYEVGH